jgi:hypothetical protein
MSTTKEKSITKKISTVSISEVMPLIKMCDVTGISLCIDGFHGIGKTEVVKQYAIDNNMHIETLHLSQKDIGDLLGIPNTVTKPNGRIHTEWAPPVYFENIMEAHANGQRSLLFLDELNRGALDVRQASLQLMLDKQLATHILPKDTLIIAAVNPSDGNYQVEELDPALLNRLMYIYAESDAEGWLKWSREHNVNAIVRDFIRSNPKHLNDNGAATPRSWTKCGLVVDNIKLLPIELQLSAIVGTVGGVGTEFVRFMSNYIQEIKLEDVIETADTLYKQEMGKDKVYELAGTQLFDAIVHKLESISQIDFANTLKDSVIQIAKEVKNIKENDLHILLTYLYSLKLETLHSILRSWKDTSETTEFFFKLMQFDPNKALIMKVRDMANVAA